MIKYEIYINAQDELYGTFESAYQFKPSEQIFVENDGKIESVLINKITHDVKDGEHTVRLNCYFKSVNR